MSEHVDVLIVGAGLSGIGAAHHLQERCPGKSYAILEARADIGGTWDLFRYPGIRSDSDMHTLGYRFRPWTDPKSIADGPSILRYVRATASEGGIDRHIRLEHRVVNAGWSSEEARWSVEARRGEGGETVTMTCGFLFMNSGYYRYDEGYTPDFPGLADFGGTVVHPQHWPEDLDYAGKRVVVIGSGATAVTLVPAMAKDAAQVTMLQRSPTYIVSMPGEDGIANFLHRYLPDRVVYPIVRWKNVVLQGISYRLSRRRPELMKKLLRRGVMKALPPGYDVDTHFKPRYNPWDQRLCLVPDGDLFKTLRDGDAEIVTDRIESFTAAGIKLESGEELEADVVVTATGLNLLFLGGMKVSIDGEEPDMARALTYKGMMLSDFPNFAYTLGYTNASWTLKADLTSEYICRLLNHMDADGHRIATPKVSDPSITEEPLLDFNSGYVLRSLHRLPKQGSKEPWKLRQNYPLDLRTLRHGPVADGIIEFSNPAPRAQPATQVLASSS
ncbi:MAG: NAD(P)/FAD-dependent oxidoreductase [Solirubrobacterales bacterium]|nr:NAD(P)/FAD-dependent oxidoreductase [Solirubrobacterales bacterium]